MSAADDSNAMLARRRGIVAAVIGLCLTSTNPISAQSTAPPAPIALPTPVPSSSPIGLPNRAATSVSIEFSGPSGWRQATVLGKTMFVIADGPAKIHGITFFGMPTKSDLATYAAEQMLKAGVHGETVENDGPSTSCGDQPAQRYTVHSLSASGEATVTHYLITAAYGGMGTAMYTHAASVGDRQDALDAMAKLCPGVAPLAYPLGWTRPKSNIPGFSGTATSPDLSSTFFATSVPLAAQSVADYERRKAIIGTVVSDRTEPCLSGTVHRVDVRAGGQLAEVASTFRRGFEYRAIYTRPAALDPDPAAERALTAFCRPVDPSAAAPV